MPKNVPQKAITSLAEPSKTSLSNAIAHTSEPILLSQRHTFTRTHTETHRNTQSGAIEMWTSCDYIVLSYCRYHFAHFLWCAGERVARTAFSFPFVFALEYGVVECIIDCVSKYYCYCTSSPSWTCVCVWMCDSFSIMHVCCYFNLGIFGWFRYLLRSLFISSCLCAVRACVCVCFVCMSVWLFVCIFIYSFRMALWIAIDVHPLSNWQV